MGVVKNISIDEFPKQSDKVGKIHSLCFKYDPDRRVDAVCIRDDKEDPWMTIFQDVNGRVILATECHYQLPTDAT